MADSSNVQVLGTRPQLFTYRVYPGEGLWPEGRPPRVTASIFASLLMRSIVSLIRQRPLLFRSPGIAATKAAAIRAYDSQSGLLGGELRYVWGKSVELYWPMKGDGSTDV